MRRAIHHVIPYMSHETNDVIQTRFWKYLRHLVIFLNFLMTSYLSDRRSEMGFAPIQGAGGYAVELGSSRMGCCGVRGVTAVIVEAEGLESLSPHSCVCRERFRHQQTSECRSELSIAQHVNERVQRTETTTITIIYQY